MKDVARLAGTSTSTVSHVINNNRYVSPAVKEKVLAAVAALNYAPSALARSLKVKETRTIGMLLTSSNNPFFAEVVRGVEHNCYEQGYSLILCNTEGSQARLQESLEVLLQKQVDGLLLMCSESEPISTDLFRCYPHLPIVMMDWTPFNRCCDVIQDNSLLGGQLATDYLIRRGFQRIACITGPKGNTQASDRLAGYRQALQAADIVLSTEYEVEGDFQFAGGLTAMQQLLALSQPPQAVFICNDAMAVGAYQALFQAGLTVGRDVAVLGYDDIELAAYLSPPLTTIHQPKEALGKLAVDTLLQRIENSELPSQTLALTPQLIIRQSV